MERKDHIDLFGVVSLVGFACVLAFNQVVIKVGTGGFQPVFMAGIRSLGALFVLILWMRLRGVPVDFSRRYWASGILLGALFGFEFVCLFWALDNTTVSRASILFYTSELAEVPLACDRAVVIFNGRVVGEVDAAEASEETLMQLAYGLGIDKGAA